MPVQDPRRNYHQRACRNGRPAAAVGSDGLARNEESRRIEAKRLVHDGAGEGKPLESLGCGVGGEILPIGFLRNAILRIGRRGEQKE